MCLNEVCKFREGGMHLRKLDCTKKSAEESQEKKKPLQFLLATEALQVFKLLLKSRFL